MLKGYLKKRTNKNKQKEPTSTVKNFIQKKKKKKPKPNTLPTHFLSYFPLFFFHPPSNPPIQTEAYIIWLLFIVTFN